MTKKEALRLFNDMEKGYVIERYGKGGKIALAEHWSNFTDILCKDRQISLKQYETWANPF